MAHRMNSQIIVLASAARTASDATTLLATATTYLNEGGSGICVVLDATAASASPGVTLSIYGTDANGVDHLLLAGAAVTGVSTNVYWVFPSATVTANVSANKFLPRRFKVTTVHADADSLTYSISADILR